MLNISGKTHHVLSRICDSGVDHTQRSNAFAHHLVLETAELETAGGGPAWMLEQPGVMAERRDVGGGVSGTLPANRLARGDTAASRICRALGAAGGGAAASSRAQARGAGPASTGGQAARTYGRAPTARGVHQRSPAVRI